MKTRMIVLNDMDESERMLLCPIYCTTILITSSSKQLSRVCRIHSIRSLIPEMDCLLRFACACVFLFLIRSEGECYLPKGPFLTGHI